MVRGLFILSLLLMLSCGNNGSEVATNEEPIDEVVQVVEEIHTPQFNMVPDEHRAILGKECSGIEASFYFSSKSISSKECLSFLSMLDASVPIIESTNEVGHITFIVNNEIYSLAKVVLQDSSGYLRFDIDGENYYHNLTASGFDFFQGMASD